VGGICNSAPYFGSVLPPCRESKHGAKHENVRQPPAEPPHVFPQAFPRFHSGMQGIWTLPVFQQLDGDIGCRGAAQM
jgi:hypothetical protein